MNDQLNGGTESSRAPDAKMKGVKMLQQVQDVDKISDQLNQEISTQSFNQSDSYDWKIVLVIQDAAKMMTAGLDTILS